MGVNIDFLMQTITFATDQYTSAPLTTLKTLLSDKVLMACAGRSSVGYTLSLLDVPW